MLFTAQIFSFFGYYDGLFSFLLVSELQSEGQVSKEMRDYSKIINNIIHPSYSSFTKFRFKKDSSQSHLYTFLLMGYSAS